MKRDLFNEQITFIYVNDLEVSRIFYEEVMGFHLILDQGKCRIVQAIRGGGAYLGYCAASGKSTDSSRVILTFVSPGVDDWYQYLKEVDVDILAPPKENPEFGIYHFFLKDPDGYLLEIQHFLIDDWNVDLERAGG